MKIKFLTKCAHISKKHVVFNFTIRKNKSKVICEGNVIVNTSLHTKHKILVINEKYKRKCKKLLPDIIDSCRDQAQFIFEDNDAKDTKKNKKKLEPKNINTTISMIEK